MVKICNGWPRVVYTTLVFNYKPGRRCKGTCARRGDGCDVDGEGYSLRSLYGRAATHRQPLGPSGVSARSNSPYEKKRANACLLAKPSVACVLRRINVPHLGRSGASSRSPQAFDAQMHEFMPRHKPIRGRARALKIDSRKGRAPLRF
jgi:hypothetical protein